MTPVHGPRATCLRTFGTANQCRWAAVRVRTGSKDTAYLLPYSLSGEPARHTYCPDEDHRCQHGDDMNCPALAPACKTCNGLGYVSVRQGGTHAPTDAPLERWTCNHDGTITPTPD